MVSGGQRHRLLDLHHPMYIQRDPHGSTFNLRELLEPIFLQYGMNVVFSGHDHTYERLKAQKWRHEQAIVPSKVSNRMEPCSVGLVDTGGPPERIGGGGVTPIPRFLVGKAPWHPSRSRHCPGGWSPL